MTKVIDMKKMALALAALTAVLTSCGGDKTAQLKAVAEPSWYADSAMYVNQAALLNEMAIYPKNIVMMGDSYIADGLWREFFADTTFKNHGIENTTTEHILYNIDAVAAKHPAKLFISAGSVDIECGRNAEEAAGNLVATYKRVKALSPETAVYFCGTTNNTGEFGKFNSLMKEKASNGFTFIDLSSELGSNMDTFSWDGGKHLNGYGYEAFAKILSQYVGLKNVNVAVETQAGESRHAQKVSIFSSIPSSIKKIVMVGDCYTEQCPWGEILPFPAIISRACSGDKISDIAERIDCIGSDDPAKIFLLAGGNDLRDFSKNISEIWKEYQSLIKKIQTIYPEVQLYIQSIVPIRENSLYDIDWKEFNNRAVELNKLLAAGVESNGYFFVDLYKLFVDESGSLAEEYTYNGVHFNPNGYFKWATELLQGPRLIIMDIKNK